MRHAPLPAAFVAILLIALVAAPSLARPLARPRDLAPERVRVEIARTGEGIARARAIVSASDDDRARQELDGAIDLQSRARTGFEARQLRIALDLTLRARARASNAVAMVRNLPDPEGVGTQLERTREVLERVRERIEECDDDRARAMLHSAQMMQTRAETAFRSERFLAALQLTTSARDRAHRGLRACKLQDSPQDNVREAAGRALRRTDEVLARAREQIGERGPHAATRVLRRAFEMQERARSEFESSRFDASLRSTQTARAFAYRSIRLSGGGA